MRHQTPLHTRRLAPAVLCALVALLASAVGAGGRGRELPLTTALFAFPYRLALFEKRLYAFVFVFG